MEDFNKNESENRGEITGFESVSGQSADDFGTANQKSGDFSSENNSDNSNNSNDGFYTKSHSDIIQDNQPQYNNYGNSYNSEYHNTDYASQNQQNTYYAAPPYVQPKPPKKRKEKKKYGAGVVVVSCLLSVVISVITAVSVMSFSDDNSPVYTKNNLPTVENSESKANAKTETKGDVNIKVNESVASISQAVAKKCSKSVVGIRTTTSVISFFGGTSESTGEGSGVVYTKDGYIITNYHVVENAITSSTASKIEVFLDNANTKSYSATVIGYNISCDLAVLKINASNLKNAEIGNSDSLTVGQYAVTIGAPGGLEFMGSVTYGIISGLNRVVSSNSQVGLIQTDAAINPGNSGGALLDKNGKLIGINSSKIVSEEFEGMGFAIPINTVVKICNGIISDKDKIEPYVGITVSEKYTSDVLEAYGYPSGAVVLSVAPGSTAENCGIQKGDIITELNGKKITEYDVFDKVLKKCKPNTKVSIKVYRSGRTYDTKIAIASNG